MILLQADIYNFQTNLTLITNKDRQLNIEERELKIISDFMGKSDWDLILSTWKKEVDYFGINLDDFFIGITSNHIDPESAVKMCFLWPRDQLKQRTDELLGQLSNRTTSFIKRGGCLSSGERNTMTYLSRVKHDHEQVIALLIGASLRSRFNRYPVDQWPSRIAIEALYELIQSYWDQSLGSKPWHSACSSVLPVINQDYGFSVNTLSGLIRYLASEHCKLLSKYNLVQVVVK